MTDESAPLPEGMSEARLAEIVAELSFIGASAAGEPAGLAAFDAVVAAGWTFDAVTDLVNEVNRLRADGATLRDAAEMLWVVLANVSGGNWKEQSADWQAAAARWRDNYFATIRIHRPEGADALMTPEHEIVICSAVICEGGYIQRGHRHHDAMDAAMKAKRMPKRGAAYQGFITSRNRFVSRSEAMDLQLAAGIGSADKEHNPDGQLRGNELYSEDLY